MSKHQKIVIIGGGTAGIMTAASLSKQKLKIDILLIEPSENHYYQPAWTLVGAGTYDFEKTVRPMENVIPDGVNWLKDSVVGFEPENNCIVTKFSGKVDYDFLVVAPGLVYDFSLVPGLGEAIDKGVVCSNYTDPIHTWKVIQEFKGGTALFTQPTTPIKCGGAPQKIMYLAENHFRNKRISDKSKIVFATPGGVIFGVKPIAETLMKVNERKDINLRFGHQLVKIDAKNQIAWYALAPNMTEVNPKELEISTNEGLVGIHYDMLHTAPPSVAPKFIQDSPLANQEKWLDVNLHTLQHTRYQNIFGLGDAAGIPTAKTGAAIRKQVPVVVNNISEMITSNTIGDKVYNGYSSCPLVTDYGKMVLAEFDYQNNFTPDPKLKQMLIFDSSKEHWRLWMLKKYGLPYLYWNKMLKGIDV
ncbi:NAD(P)/FAD-dependent oxidoreductase [Belliella sp. DSM 107340]|uniref:NAD(P)/FAD-dependent oxidoreductase n=1 Tax=Belliella calami TaxID=2923436 RepID=A0ABS9UTT8_9BACT|nr:FAD/NAD(P)-binding oxidoreductase [Belliella calami]MCH7400036.1 NAD(P)/FAD-dependent oxidoreductase [Belliella calami]